MAQVGGQELRDVVVTGIGPVFLLPETRERWNRAKEREVILRTPLAGVLHGAVFPYASHGRVLH
jgi:hypothetical protein